MSNINNQTKDLFAFNTVENLSNDFAATYSGGKAFFRIICLVFLLLAFTTLPALADDCDSKNRAPLPPCVFAEYANNGAIITNRCPYAVTIKVDIADGRDQRIDVPANAGVRVAATTGRFNLKCCPKYNKCTG